MRVWARIREDIERTDTVRCAVDRVEDGDLWKCAEVVSVNEARRLEHPHAESDVPACPSCYRWVRNIDENGVESEYEAAARWD